MLGLAFLFERGDNQRARRTSRPVAAAKPPRRSRAKTAAALKKLDGLMPLYWDENDGKLLMEIGQFDTELLYQVSLPAGVGSTRSASIAARSATRMSSPSSASARRVLMVEPNYRYRAITNDPAELRAVRDSFAQSVLWGGGALHRRSERRLARAGRR